VTRRSPEPINHQVSRLEVGIAEPFEAFRGRYEKAVPAIDPDHVPKLVERQAPWDEVVAAAEASAPHGFLIYWSSDVSALMALAGARARCVEYLMGNHTIAERMYRHDPAVMLHAPLRTAICARDDGPVRFVVDQPSTVFSSFGNAEIAAVGKELDRKLAALLTALGAPVPAALTSP
jgi:uncharacterized protein (DUF302 family)